jgi:hypothetical protein
MQNIFNCGKLKIIYEQQKKKKKEIAKSCEQYVMGRALTLITTECIS